MTSVSRREAMRKGGLVELEMPECAALYLVGYLFELGPTMAAGMGEGALNHGEIEAWQRNTGIVLNAWEARTLKQLSRDYLSEAHEAKTRGRPAPWADAPYASKVQDSVGVSLKASIRRLAS